MHGHDSFLIDSPSFLRSVRLFLEGTDQEEEKRSKVDGFRKLKNRYEVKKEADFKVIDDWVEMVLACWILVAGVVYYWNTYENQKSKRSWF